MHWHVPSRFGNSGRTAQRGQQLSHRARLAISYHQRLATRLDSAVQSRQQRVHSVDHVRAVDERRSRADERQPTASGAIYHSGNELRVARTPYQVWAYRDYGQLAMIGGQRDLLGARLASRVRTPSGQRVGGLCAAANQRAPGMNDRRR